MADENNNNGGDGAAQNNGSSTLLNQGGGGNSNGQGQQQQQQSQPLGANDWIVEGKFGTGLASRLPEDLKPYAGSIQKFEGTPLTDVLKSYGELEKKLGSRVQPPGPDAKPEEVAAWRKIVGTPEKPEDYKIEKPENVPAELWNPELVKGFQGVAHELNLSPAQAGKLAEWWNGQNMAMLEQHQQTTAANQEALADGLKKEWGERFDANLKGAQFVATKAGLDVNDPEIGNNPAIIKALAAVSALISEDKQVTGGQGGSHLNYQQQAEDISTNKGNPRYADYHGQNGPERQAAAQREIHRLMALAGGKA
jgi:hypothetical protein